MRESSRRLMTGMAVALALCQGGCSLSLTGKDLCVTNADCLDGNKCREGLCVSAATCAVSCGGVCCVATEYCDSKSATCKPLCTPDCVGRQCGDDGCNGSCGSCGAGFKCNTDQMCQGCEGHCNRGDEDASVNECGPDGCGRKCGTCRLGQYCDDDYKCVGADAGGVFSDAGGSVSDAGIFAGDAGGSVADGGGWFDAGGTSGDAGSSPIDASGFQPDADVDLTDAGIISPPDAKLHEPDVGDGFQSDAQGQGDTGEDLTGDAGPPGDADLGPYDANPDGEDVGYAEGDVG